MIWLLLIPAAYLLVLLAVAWISLHPFRTPAFISPGALGKPQVDVEFDSTDGIRLRGWWSRNEGSRNVAVLCHGYMMNRCKLTPLAVRLFDMPAIMGAEAPAPFDMPGRAGAEAPTPEMPAGSGAEAPAPLSGGFSTLVFDFRAHGKSSGKKCSFGLSEADDVRAAVEFARRQVDGAKVVLIGSSMGAAASALALAKQPGLADALILDSAYSQLPSAMSGWWRFLGGPVLSFLLSPAIVVAMPFAGLNPFKVDVGEALKKVTIPVLLLHGDCDTLALPSQAQRNCDACAAGEMVWLPECGHSEGRWEHPQMYEEAVFRFLARVMPP